MLIGNLWGLLVQQRRLSQKQQAILKIPCTGYLSQNKAQRMDQKFLLKKNPAYPSCTTYLNTSWDTCALPSTTHLGSGGWPEHGVHMPSSPDWVLALEFYSDLPDLQQNSAVTVKDSCHMEHIKLLTNKKSQWLH